jgi:predicted MFS family arabinose efflux permease
LNGVLGNRSFRSLWLAGSLSRLGSEVSRIGLFLYLLDENKSVLILATLVALRTLPGAITAPAAGFVVDRWSKRSVMIASDLTRMALLLGILWRPGIEAIYIAAALHSVATVLFEPAKAAALALVVEKGEMLRANGFERSTTNVLMVLGPILGAELFLQGGLAAILAVDAVSYLASALLTSRVNVRSIASLAPPQPLSSALVDVRAGWEYLAQKRWTLVLILLLGVSLLCGGLWIPLAPFFVREHLGGSERLFALQLGSFGAGGMVGGALAAHVWDRAGRGGALRFALLAEACHLVLYALFPHPIVSALILFSWGATVSMIGVCSYSLLQVHVDERYLGRALSVVKQAENLAILGAMLLAAGLSGHLSSQTIFVVSGLCYFSVVTVTAASRDGRALLGFSAPEGG